MNKRSLMDEFNSMSESKRKRGGGDDACVYAYAIAEVKREYKKIPLLKQFRTVSGRSPVFLIDAEGDDTDAYHVVVEKLQGTRPRGKYKFVNIPWAEAKAKAAVWASGLPAFEGCTADDVSIITATTMTEIMEALGAAKKELGRDDEGMEKDDEKKAKEVPKKMWGDYDDDEGDEDDDASREARRRALAESTAALFADKGELERFVVEILSKHNKARNDADVRRGRDVAPDLSSRSKTSGQGRRGGRGAAADSFSDSESDDDDDEVIDPYREVRVLHGVKESSKGGVERERARLILALHEERVVSKNWSEKEIVGYKRQGVTVFVRFASVEAARTFSRHFGSSKVLHRILMKDEKAVTARGCHAGPTHPFHPGRGAN